MLLEEKIKLQEQQTTLYDKLNDSEKSIIQEKLYRIEIKLNALETAKGQKIADFFNSNINSSENTLTSYKRI